MEALRRAASAPVGAFAMLPPGPYHAVAASSDDVFVLFRAMHRAAQRCDARAIAPNT